MFLFLGNLKQLYFTTLTSFKHYTKKLYQKQLYPIQIGCEKRHFKISSTLLEDRSYLYEPDIGYTLTTLNRN